MTVSTTVTMPPRRRPHAKRRDAVSTTGRRISDTKRGLAGSLFLGTDMGGLLRFVLLGAFVGGVVAFLFYPDISRILERWRNSSEEGSGFPSQSEAESHVQGDTHAHPVKTEPRKAETRRSAKTGDTAKKAKPSTKQRGNQQDKAIPRDGCACEKHVAEPGCKLSGNAEKRKTTKEKRPQKEDLMEEEELEVEEEDSVEVELMEEEDTVEYIDLKDDDETLTEPAHAEDGATDVEESAGEDHAEPTNLKDEQTLTFTPVSPGDESVIRLGGRPKPGSKTSTRDGRSPNKSKAATPTNPSKKNSSTKTETPRKASKKAKALEPTSTTSSQTKQESGKRRREKRKRRREKIKRRRDHRLNLRPQKGLALKMRTCRRR